MVGPSRLLVGLGNPGEEYAATRHNLGFRVVEEIAARRGVRLDGEECAARIVRAGELLLAQPRTYMNRSGFAVRCLAERHGVAPAETLVIYDDVALPLGRLRLRGGGSAGGHRGMESVLDGLRTEEVPRLRLGVGTPAGAAGGVVGEGLATFVLAPFSPDEAETVRELVTRAADAAVLWSESGLTTAANRYNG